MNAALHHPTAPTAWHRPAATARRAPLLRAAALGVSLALLALPTLGQPSAGDGGTEDGGLSWSFSNRSPALELGPPVPPDFDIALVLDDDTVEGDFGVDDGNGAARQFLWFNQFDLDPLPKIVLEEVWVFFAPGPNVVEGAPIDLVVYHDNDDDPTNGATFLASYAETIQVVDGSSFSVYPLDASLALPRGGDLLVGVIPRFIESGVTPATNPASLDTSGSLGQSWVAVWNDDPPAVPDLPSDFFVDRVDVFVPGNWAIRAFGNSQTTVEIPTLGQGSLVVLALLLAGLAAIRLRRAG